MKNVPLVFKEQIEKVKNILFRRRMSYCQTFKIGDPYAVEVLIDLARFCRHHDTTFHADARIHAVLEGRREVFLRIVKHLKLDPDQFLQYYGKGIE